MNKKVKIKTSDKHTIHGTLTFSKKRSSKLLIFVHGLTGFQNEHIFYNAARLFPSKGFDVLRFDLYSGEKGGRVLTDTSISLHASDVNTVVGRFKKRYKKIFLIGHSLGGPSILLSDQKHVSGMILWDSSCTLKIRHGISLRYVPALKKYLLSWGVEYLMSKAMVKEWTELPRPKDLIQRITVPLKVMCAGNGMLIKAGKEYYKYAKVPKAFSIIKSAGHTFDEEGAEMQLFEETLGFVRKHS